MFGSLNVDTILDVERQPAWGETLMALGSSSAPGGKGANQAVAARRLGAAVRMVGRVGADAGGELLRASLRADGVEDGLVAEPGVPTGAAFILRAPDGQNCIVVAAGANSRAEAGDLLSVPEVEGRSVLVLQLEVAPEQSRAAAALGRERGWHVILNPAPARAVDAGFLDDVDTLIANEHEAAQLTGLEVHDASSALTAAEALRRRGPTSVAITLGAQGAVVVTDRGAWRAAPPRVQVVDTTAAGDAFVGAVAVATLEGLPAPEMLRWAVAAGTCTVTRPGAQPALPRRAETLALATAVQVSELSLRDRLVDAAASG